MFVKPSRAPGRCLIPQRRIARRHDLAGTGEFGMVGIDDGDRDALAAGHLVRCLRIGVRVDRHAIDRGLLKVPLLRKNSLACPRPDQLGMAVFHVIALTDSTGG